MSANNNIKNFRYPLSAVETENGSLRDDFIKFTSFAYKRKKREVDPRNVISPGGAGPVLTTLSEKGGYLVGGIEDAGTTTEDAGTTTNSKINSTILLPIPSTISDTNAANYGSNSLNDYYASAVGSVMNITGSNDPKQFFENIGGAFGNIQQALEDQRSQDYIKTFLAVQAVGALGANIDTNSIFARATGSIINPNMELLFSGPTLREFKFQFKFTPRNEKESKQVRSIIKEFKRSMAPRLKNGSFMSTPDVFKIEYVGKSKDYLNKFKNCALRNMSVNYTGEGNYATYHSGAPISMIMDLSFQELEPVYSDAYDNEENIGY